MSGLSWWLAFAVLQLLQMLGLAASLVMLPGNWLMVLALGVWVWLSGGVSGPGWWLVGVAFVLAVLGEVLETVLGSAVAGRRGATRRAMLMSLLLSMVGSLVGTLVVPIPVVGSVIGAILGAAGGAFAGAWLGEAWAGTERVKRVRIGTAAMQGRLLGMAAKLAVGLVIFCLQAVMFVF
ncbi:MAG: hypothetical protein RIT02_2865 [Planctomycetota bacterium]|jgi:hypothetical protein